MRLRFPTGKAGMSGCRLGYELVCLPSLPHLIIDTFDLIEQALGAQGLGVVLLEVHGLVVQGLEVRFLILLAPDLVEALLGLPPLLFLGLQPVERGAQCLMPQGRAHFPPSKHTDLYGTETEAGGCPVLGWSGIQ